MAEKDIEKTPLGLAQLVKSKLPHLKRDRYGVFYIYKGDEYGYYESLEVVKDEGIKREIYHVLLEAGYVRKIREHLLKEIAMMLKYDKGISIDEMDTNHNWIGMKNGVFDIQNNELRPHSCEHNITMALNIDYDPNATCPKFEKFLSDIMCEDQLLVENLMMIGGFILFCHDPVLKAQIEKMFIFVGEGGNGKSVLIRIFRSLFHKEYITSLSLQDLTSSSGNSVRSPLIKSRINICSEGKEGDLIRGEDELKKIISGEEINIKKLYVDIMEIRSKTKIIQATNHPPVFIDMTQSLRRRMLLIDFKKSYLDKAKYEHKLKLFKNNVGELEKRNIYPKDKMLVFHLLKELPGIFNLFFQGYLMLLSRDLEFHMTNVMEEDMLDKLYSNNPVYNFVKNYCEIGDEYDDDDQFTAVDDLYQVYRDWYAEHWRQRGDSVTQKKLTTLIKQLYPGQIEAKTVRKDVCVNPNEFDASKIMYAKKPKWCINVKYVGEKDLEDDTLDEEIENLKERLLF